MSVTGSRAADLLPDDLQVLLSGRLGRASLPEQIPVRSVS